MTDKGTPNLDDVPVFDNVTFFNAKNAPGELSISATTNQNNTFHYPKTKAGQAGSPISAGAGDQVSGQTWEVPMGENEEISGVTFRVSYPSVPENIEASWVGWPLATNVGDVRVVVVDACMIAYGLENGTNPTGWGSGEFNTGS